MRVRLRGAFGESGMMPSVSSANPEEIITIWEGNGVTGYEIGLPPAPRPEITNEYESGADLSLWDDRMTVAATWYWRITNNVFFTVPLGFDFGTTEDVTEQGADIHNTGVEGNVSVVLVRGPRITWDVSLNASANANKVVSFPDGGAQGYDDN